MWTRTQLRSSIPRRGTAISSKKPVQTVSLISSAWRWTHPIPLGIAVPRPISPVLLFPSIHKPHILPQRLYCPHATSSAGDESSKQDHHTEHAAQLKNDQYGCTSFSPSATGPHDPDEYDEYPPPPTAEEFCHWVIKGYDSDPPPLDSLHTTETASQVYVSALQKGLKLSLAYCALAILIAKKTSVAVSVVAWQYMVTTVKFCHVTAIKLWHLTVVTATFIGQVCSVVWDWLVKVWTLVSEVTTSSVTRVKRLLPVYARQARVKTVKFVPKSARDRWKEMSKPDPAVRKKGLWEKIFWWWEHPVVKSVRITLSVANFGVRLPAIMALGTAVMTQLGLLTSQFTLPMLAPLLLGTGMLLQSVSTNASLLLPRFGLLLVLLWLIWVVSSVIMNTWVILRRQGRLDVRTAAGLITLTETTALVVALIVLLSMVGVNISALLIPAAICMAFASRDLLSNMMAGLFLFIAQPFRIGDTVAVISSATAQSPSPSVMGGSQPAPTGPGGGWFQGECEKVDLRYTVLRQGKWRLMVPNASFILREFMVADNPDAPASPSAASSTSDNRDPLSSMDQPGNLASGNQPRPMFLWPYGPDGSMPTASAWFFRVGPPAAGQPAAPAAAAPPMPPADPWNPAAGFSMTQYSYPVAGPDGTTHGGQVSVYASYEEVVPPTHPSTPYGASYPSPPSPWTAPPSVNSSPSPQYPPQATPAPNPMNHDPLPPATPASAATSSASHSPTNVASPSSTQATTGAVTSSVPQAASNPTSPPTNPTPNNAASPSSPQPPTVAGSSATPHTAANAASPSSPHTPAITASSATPHTAANAASPSFLYAPAITASSATPHPPTTAASPSSHAPLSEVPATHPTTASPGAHTVTPHPSEQHPHANKHAAQFSAQPSAQLSAPSPPHPGAHPAMYSYPTSPYLSAPSPNPLAFTSPSFPPHWLTSTHSPTPAYPSAHPFQSTNFPPPLPPVPVPGPVHPATATTVTPSIPPAAQTSMDTTNGAAYSRQGDDIDINTQENTAGPHPSPPSSSPAAHSHLPTPAQSEPRPPTSTPNPPPKIGRDVRDMSGSLDPEGLPDKHAASSADQAHKADSAVDQSTPNSIPTVLPLSMAAAPHMSSLAPTVSQHSDLPAFLPIVGHRTITSVSGKDASIAPPLPSALTGQMLQADGQESTSSSASNPARGSTSSLPLPATASNALRVSEQPLSSSSVSSPDNDTTTSLQLPVTKHDTTRVTNPQQDTRPVTDDSIKSNNNVAVTDPELRGESAGQTEGNAAGVKPSTEN